MGALQSIDEVALQQADLERWFRVKHGTERWTTIYKSTGSRTDFRLFSYLIPPERRDEILGQPGYDFLPGGERPGFSRKYEGEEIVTTYQRIGELGGIEPVAIVREFHHGRPDYVEVAEDLRLLFNLYEDRATGVFFEIESDGSETEAIKVSSHRVEIRTSLMRRYLAARQLALVLVISSDVQLRVDDDTQTPELPDERRAATDMLCLHFYAGLLDARRPFSVLLGKKIILPPDRSECGLWPFEATEEYLDFIIDEDERGHPIEHSCEPGLLANHFGANPGAPHYLTPVFFRREVLRKYYENGEQYAVEDGGVECGALWSLRADTNHDDHVVVFLGDLGRDIPISEQRHWRAYNLMPEDRGLSETAARRSLQGEWAAAVSPEHVFKRAYTDANAAWAAAFGWSLYKDLHTNDAHVLRSLRLLLSNTNGEFDGQLRYLAILVVDSLNEKQIEVARATPPNENDKGIAKLEGLLVQLQYGYAARDLGLLRTIQKVRSTGVAHRKGSDYDLSKAGLDPADLCQSFRLLLERCIQMLTDLKSFAESQGKG
jgi:hypothetical protein